MRRSAVIIALLLSVIAVGLAYSRNISWPGYDELFAKSDLVVIAEPANKTRDTQERTVLTENIPQPVPAIGVVTDFNCLLVLKGAKRQRFTLHHYRLGESASKHSEDGMRVPIDPPDFERYEPKFRAAFLMFLVRERDGRFAPVAGQIDPGISVQPISHP
jgi:hypothetical protein